MIIKMKGYNDKGNVAIFKRLNLETSKILSCEHDIGMYIRNLKHFSHVFCLKTSVGVLRMAKNSWSSLKPTGYLRVSKVEQR